MTNSTASTTTARKTLPFSPLTDVGLAILINDRASYITYAVVSGRATDPKVRAEAQRVFDMCRAQTDRALANLRRLSGEMAA